MPDPPDLLAQDLEEELDVLPLAQPAQDSEEESDVLPPDLLAQDSTDSLVELDKPQPAQDLVVVVQEMLLLVLKAQDSVDLMEVFQEAQPLLKAPDLVVSEVEHPPDLVDLRALALVVVEDLLVVLKALASVEVVAASVVLKPHAASVQEETSSVDLRALVLVEAEAVLADLRALASVQAVAASVVLKHHAASVQEEAVLADLRALASVAVEAALEALKAHALVDSEDAVLVASAKAEEVSLAASVVMEPAEESAVAPVVLEDNKDPVSDKEGPEDMEAEALADLLSIEEIDFLTVYICAIREIVSANFVATISLSFINYIITLSTGF